VVVGQHLHQQRDRALGPAGDRGPAEHPQQGGERQQHEIMPFPQMGTLVGEHGGQLGLVEQLRVPALITIRDRRPGTQ